MKILEKIGIINNIFLNYENAEEFVHKLNLKSQKEWTQYCKSGNKPDNIPNKPQRFYENKGWISWGQWLKTGVIATIKKKFLPYKEAHIFIKNSKLQNQKEWVNFCKSGLRPFNIPANPQKTYKNKGWISWGEWLGSLKISNYNKKYLSYEEAIIFVHILNLKSSFEWRDYCKSGNKPDNIPSNPDKIYKNNGWISYGHWLNTGTVATFNKKYLSYEEAHKFIKILNLKSEKEWINYCKSGNKPDNIPRAPSQVYRYSGWSSLGNWLGTGRIADQFKTFISFENARNISQKLRLKNSKEWKKYCINNNIKQIPRNPNKIYKNKGWISYQDWLGIEKMITFEELKLMIKKENIKTPKEYEQFYRKYTSKI